MNREILRGAMSEEHMEIVGSIYVRWASGDFSVSEWADADTKFTTPDKKRGRGTDGMASLWRDW